VKGEKHRAVSQADTMVGRGSRRTQGFPRRTIVWMQNGVLLDCKTRRAAIYGAAGSLIQSNLDDL
jgi:hypothetical protein